MTRHLDFRRQIDWSGLSPSVVEFESSGRSLRDSHLVAMKCNISFSIKSDLSKPRTTHLSGAQPSIPHGSLRFSFSKSALEILDLLPITLEQSIRIDDFLLLCIQLRRDGSARFASRTENCSRTCTRLTRCAKSNVLVVSATAFVSGLIVQMTEMRAFPDNEGCSIRVSFELRYGMWSLVQVLV